MIHQWKGHGNNSVLWVKNKTENRIFTQGRSDCVRLWDIDQYRSSPISSYSTAEYMGFSQSDVLNMKDNICLLVIPGPEQESVTVYDTRSNKKVSSLRPSDPKSTGSVMQVKWVDLGIRTFVLVAYESGCIAAWDWSNNLIFSQINLPENPMCIMYNKIDNQGVCGTNGEKIYTFTISKESGISKDCEISIINPGIACCTSRPDGKIFATGGWDDRIRLFSWKKKNPLAVLVYHRQTVQCMCYSQSNVELFPPGNILACGSMDRTISLWNLYN